MKALTIPASRPSMRERMRSISATVSILRARIGSRACLSSATAATIGLFFALGMQSFPGTIFCGLIALSSAAITPMGDTDTTIDKEGGAA